MRLNEKTGRILTERFQKDSIIALATTDDGLPQVRYVDAYYENGAFYTVTHALSAKMKQIERCPAVAIAGDWFTAHGRGISLGFWGRAENRAIVGKLREAFRAWIDNGHSDLTDENTIILCVQLTDGVLFSNGIRYDIEFQ